MEASTEARAGARWATFPMLERVRRWSHRRSWPVLDLLPEDVSTAVRVVRQHKMAYWDALIWSTAKRAGLRAVLSEDFQDGRRLEGIHFLNPLVDRFELQLLT